MLSYFVRCILRFAISRYVSAIRYMNWLSGKSCTLGLCAWFGLIILHIKWLLSAHVPRPVSIGHYYVNYGSSSCVPYVNGQKDTFSYSSYIVRSCLPSYNTNSCKITNCFEKIIFTITKSLLVVIFTKFTKTESSILEWFFWYHLR